ncbi:MAG: 16S rRNA (guanine(966)-N(2))-methyltransferase RsmD [Pseudomonadota bacterium]
MARRQKKSQPGRLRIVAGNWRSRLLQIADVPGLRPTSERVRETLFNWLADDIHGARCLDLCAGTGALGLEALSRGAGQSVFVETSAVAAQALQANIGLLDAENAEVINGDACRFLENYSDLPFDLVFLDPPFAEDMLGDLCRLLGKGQALADDALVYLEMDRKQAPPELPAGWSIEKDKTAGNVRYLLVRAVRNEQ